MFSDETFSIQWRISCFVKGRLLFFGMSAVDLISIHDFFEISEWGPWFGGELRLIKGLECPLNVANTFNLYWIVFIDFGGKASICKTGILF